MKKLLLVLALSLTACVTQPAPIDPTPIEDNRGVVPGGYIQLCEDQPESVLCEGN